MKASYLNCDFNIQRPSPWTLEKSQISLNMERKVAVSEFGNFEEKWPNSSLVVAWPLNLHPVAIKSLISLIKISWLDLWMSLTAYCGREGAFRWRIVARSAEDEVWGCEDWAVRRAVPAFCPSNSWDELLTCLECVYEYGPDIHNGHNRSYYTYRAD